MVHPHPARYNTTPFNERNKMRTITTAANQITIIANIKSEIQRLYDTNRTLLDLGSNVAHEEMQRNWNKIAMLKRRLSDRLDPHKTKVCPPA